MDSILENKKLTEIADKKESYHFIGIGGIGMSALAHLLLQQNIAVSGSDLSATATVAHLKNLGAKIFSSHSKENISSGSTVVYNSYITKDNSEMDAAIHLNCTVIHRSELLAFLAERQKMIAIAGTHGKTTTTALLTWVLHCAQKDPSYVIGGIVPQLSTHGKKGSGTYFIAEADESDGTFLRYRPHGAIVTNIDCDHMDYFGAKSHLVQAFQTFISHVAEPSLLFWGGDNSELKSICSKGVSYGFHPECDLRITSYKPIGWSSIFSLNWKGVVYSDIELALCGEHNVTNAAAVFGLSLALGIEENRIREAFSSFGGVLRRCQMRGECRAISLIDDYAHHPEAVSKTIKAIRSAIGERRLIIVFQPHRYSRTVLTLGQWGAVFNGADKVFITEIYGAWEKELNVSHDAIIKEVDSSSLPCSFLPRLVAAEFLAKMARPHDVIVTMGAGNITQLPTEILEIWEKSPPKPLVVGLISGGQSGEHAVALDSVKHIIEGLEQPHYEINYFAITKEGKWLQGAAANNLYQAKEYDEPEDKITGEVLSRLACCEVLFPVLHGPRGEDGTIQGFFEMMGKAYVGCEPRGAAISMDKGVVKRLAQSCGVPTLPFIECEENDWRQNREDIYLQIEEKIAYPIFVKPAHCGSSLGISKVESYEQLEAAIENGFKHDYLLIIEKAAEGWRELEFALYGNQQIAASFPGEIITNGKLYDYGAKYGVNAFSTSCQPQGLTDDQVEEGKAFAVKIYRACRCTGLARVDFFFDPQRGAWWLNEINPLPGFTSNSLYPKMCAQEGVSITQLVDKLAALAIHRHHYLQRFQ